MKPYISVLMPVYNGEKYLKHAIDSILNQTFPNFEFIIINDGSTDKTEDIILSYNDIRIRYFKNKLNLKIVRTLNKGIKLAKGEYIARMDADDMCLPNRFKIQVQFMEQNKDVDVCGTWMSIINHNRIWEFPLSHEEIKAFLLFGAALSHPSTLIRHSLFDTFQYSNEYDKAEDYHLWCQVVESKKIQNIPIALYQYRFHQEMTNIVARSKQIEGANKVRKHMIMRTGIIPSNNEMELHINFSLQKLDLKNIDQIIKWLTKILTTNETLNYYDDTSLKKSIGEFWWQLFSKNTFLGLPAYKFFMLSSFRSYSQVPIKKYIKFFFKCLIKHKYEPN